MFRKMLLAIAVSTAMLPAAGLAGTGPSSSQSPYLTSIAPGVKFSSILTVGDAVKKKNKGNETYRMVGIPDGLGAYNNDDGTITVLMNQELTPSRGVPRAHGGTGAFVSRYQIRKSDLKVLNGEDLMKNVKLWDPIGQTYVDGNGTAFSRFCSADLASRNAFYNGETDRGFDDGRIFMNGEEDDAAGRAMAHIVGGRYDGTSYELPLMGKHAWENLLASPYEQDKTIVAGNEDGGLNKVFFYIGMKQEDGNPIDQAGLANGTTYELNIFGYTNDDPVTGFKSGAFSLVPSGGTSLARPEDGAWDTVNPNRYYFVTTASFTGNSRLWRMTFSDITHPELGGTIEVLVDGIVDGPKMMDNITVDTAGNVYMQEDVGNQVHLGKVWKYQPKTDSLTLLAEHDAARFIAGAIADIDGTDGKQSDEESSGIIEVTKLFDHQNGYDTHHNRYFLLDVQAHYTSVNGVALDPELVEGGQLLLMTVPGGEDSDEDGHDGHDHGDHGRN